MFSVITHGEDRQIHAIIQNLADVPGGVSVQTSELVTGTILKEGSVIGAKDSNGLCHVIKTARVYADAEANATAIKIEKNSQLKAGDFVAATLGGASVKVSSVDNSNYAYDTITVALNSSTGLAALEAGAALTAVSAAATTGAALAYAPIAIAGDSHDVVGGDNLWVNAVVMGTVKASCVAIADDLAAKLKGIIII